MASVPSSPTTTSVKSVAPTSWVSSTAEATPTHRSLDGSDTDVPTAHILRIAPIVIAVALTILLLITLLTVTFNTLYRRYKLKTRRRALEVTTEAFTSSTMVDVAADLSTADETSQSPPSTPISLRTALRGSSDDGETLRGAAGVISPMCTNQDGKSYYLESVSIRVRSDSDASTASSDEDGKLTVCGTASASVRGSRDLARCDAHDPIEHDSKIATAIVVDVDGLTEQLTDIARKS